MDKNKLYPEKEDQNPLNLNDSDAIDEQDQEDLDDIDKQDVATDNQNAYNIPTQGVNKARTPTLVDQLFGTPVAAAEPDNAQVENLKDLLTSGPVTPQVDKTKEPSEITTPTTDIPKPEKKAENSDQTAYDITTGMPIGTADEGSFYGKAQESDWAKRNFIVGPITEKLAKGESVDTSDLINASYTESILGGIINNLIKVPYTFHYISAAISDAMGEEGIPVDEGKVAEVTRKIQENPIFGKLAKGASEAEEQTAVGEISGFIASLIGPAKVAKAIGLGSKIVGWATTGRLMVGSGEEVVRAAQVANELNKMTRTGRFVTIAAGDAVDGLITNALIADTSQIATFGNLFGGPTAADLEQKKFAKDEADRLLINRLKFATEGALVPIVFAFGKSKPYSEAARQTQNLIKNDHEFETFLDKYGKEKIAGTPDTLESLAPVTLYAGIPFDAMAALAKQAGKPVYEFIKDTANLAKRAGMPVYDFVRETIIPSLRSSGKLDPKLASLIGELRGERNALQRIDAVDAKNALDRSLTAVLKDRSLLQTEAAPNIINATDEFLHSGEYQIARIVETPEGKIITATEGITTEEQKLTPTKRQSYIEKEEYFKKRWNDSLDQNDGLSASKFNKQSRDYGAAAYKNKPIEKLTADDYLDYHKYKHPKDYFPERYKEYPGEHWTDRAKAASRVAKGLPAEAPSVIKEVNNLLDYQGNVIGKVLGKELQFKGFGRSQGEYYNKLKKYGLEDSQIEQLVKNVTDVREKMANYFTKTIHPDVMEEALDGFNSIMKDRTNPFLNSEYAIFNNKSVKWGYSYKPSMESINEIKQILIDNAKAAGTTLSEADLNVMLNNIAEASLNSKTLTPEFTVRNIDKLSKAPDRLTINLRKSIDAEGKFVENAIIKTKEQLEAFEKYFGKVKDVGSNVYSLIEDAGMYSARSKIFSNIEKINAQALIDGKNALFYVGDYGQAENYFLTKGIKGKDLVEFKPDYKFLNPFKGTVYTTKEVAEALTLAQKIPFSKLYQMGIYRNFITPIQSYLSAKNTVLSVPREILNGVQYLVMSAANGTLYKNPALIWDNFKQSFRVSRTGLLGESPKADILRNVGATGSLQFTDRELYRYFISKNIGMTHLNIGNLEDILRDNKAFNKIVSGQIEPTFKTIGGSIQKVYQFTKDFYMTTDNFFKFFNTLSEYDSLSASYKNAVKRGLITESQIPSAVELMDMATKKVQDLLPNYEKVSQGVKALSKLPFAGNYVLWPSEMIRNVYSAYRIGWNEFSNPITRDIGLKRLASMTTALGVLGGGASAIWNPTVGYTNEKLGALRRFVSRYSEYSTLLGVPDDEYGRPGYIDFDHFNPYSNVTSPFTVLMAAMNEGKFKDPDNYLLHSGLTAVLESALKATESYRQEKLIFKPITDLIFGKGRTDEGKEIWSQNDDFGEKFYKGSMYLLGEFLPPVNFESRLYRAYSNTPDENGQKYNKLDETLTLLGLRIRRIDPVQSFNYKVGKYNGINRTINSDIAKFNRNYTNDNPDDFAQEFYKQNQIKYNAFTDLANDYKAAQVLGADSDELRQANKSHRKLLNELENEEFTPIKSFTKQVKKALDERELNQDRFFNGERFEIPDIEDIKDTVQDMKEDMQGLPPNKKFNDLINIKNYLTKPSLFNRIFPSKPSVAPLPTQPNPNANVVSPVNQQANNISRAEEARILNI